MQGGKSAERRFSSPVIFGIRTWDAEIGEDILFLIQNVDQYYLNIV